MSNFYPLVPNSRPISDLGDLNNVYVPSPSDNDVIAWSVANNRYEAVSLDNAAVFGQGRVYTRDDTERCTTSKTVWTTQLTMVTPTLEAGTYRLGWRLDHAQDIASKSMDIRVRENGSDLEAFTVTTNDNIQTHFAPTSGFIHLAGVTAGVKTIDLEFKATNLSGNFEVCMKNARLEWWRVA